MRKMLLCLLLLAAVLFAIPAAADSYVFDDLFASITVPDSYLVLRPENLDGYADWLEAHGSTTEEKSNDFLRRGVLLQAINNEDENMVFELRAVHTEKSELLFDINEQNTSVRAEYRTSHYPDNLYSGYDFSASEWKNTAEGRFLILKYTRRDSGEILYKGLMRRTIRNGWQLDFDMMISNRAVTAKDNTALNTIWESFHFIQVQELPPAAAAKVSFTEAPPEETKKQKFDIEGTAAEGVHLTAVTMGLSYPDPIVCEAIVGSDEKFTLPIELPREGVFLITITAAYKDEDVLELAYPVTYQHTLLTVNFTQKPGEVVKENEVKLAGTGEPGASIQVFMNGELLFKKKVTTAGKFAFTVDCPEEGEQEINLVFSKKGLADRRFTFPFSRVWTDSDMMKYLKKESITPSYASLVKKIAKYEGRILAYKAYIVDIGQSGDEYIIRMAMNRKNKKYSNFLLVTSDEMPSFEVGKKVQLYGTCEGMSLSTETAAEGTEEESLPCLDLLLFVSLE